MIKAVIFDMDGVLVDTEKYHEKAYRYVSKTAGAEITGKEIIKLKGVTALEIFKYLLKKHNIRENPKKYALLKDKVYRSYLKNIKLLPGVLDLLKKLKKNKVKVALASSGSRLNVQFILKKLKIKKYFDAVIDGEQVKRGKPAPDVFLKAAEKLKVNPSEGIVIEDTNTGIIAGKKSGMFVVAVTTTFPKSKLKDADLVVDSLKELKIEIISKGGGEHR
ncbi:MAG: HAD family phosphatase [archaeon]